MTIPSVPVRFLERYIFEAPGVPDPVVTVTEGGVVTIPSVPVRSWGWLTGSTGLLLLAHVAEGGSCDNSLRLPGQDASKAPRAPVLPPLGSSCGACSREGEL